MYRKNHTPHETPLVVEGKSGKRLRNPNQITVNQHVIPQAHLQEWADSKKLLTVMEIKTRKSFSLAPRDAFVVCRLWDQPMEQGTIKSNEDNYQKQIEIFRTTGELACHISITEYFVMLAVRAYCAAKERPDYPTTMHSVSYVPSQADLEAAEVKQVRDSVRVIYGAGEGQEFARVVVSMTMTSLFCKGRELLKNTVWIPYVSSEAKFILPDSLWDLYANRYLAFPVSPDLVFIEKKLHESLLESRNLTHEKLNRRFLRASKQHYVRPPSCDS